MPKTRRYIFESYQLSREAFYVLQHSKFVFSKTGTKFIRPGDRFYVRNRQFRDDPLQPVGSLDDVERFLRSYY